MGQKKLYRFAQIKTFSNVLEYPPAMKGMWRGFFTNQNPVVLELACGRGEYTIGLARIYPDSNYIGVDIKGNRMYIGAREALDEQLNNVAFLRTQIEMLPNYFDEGEVDQIWITFPDPQLRASKAKKRLTHPRFLRLFHKVIKPGGVIHLKTDSPDLFQFTKLVIELYGLYLVDESDDIYSKKDLPPEIKIKTHYEKMDIAGSSKTFLLSFSLPDQIPDKDEELKRILNEG